MTDRYLNGPQVDQVLADDQVTPTNSVGTVNWYFSDQNQSVQNIVQYNAATHGAQVVNQISYDSFGNATETQPSVTHLFGFDGMQQDKETGLDYDNARYYSPSTGAFLSRDPANSGPNPYEFAGNQPTNLTDPTGLSPFLSYDPSAGSSSFFEYGGSTVDLSDVLGSIPSSFGIPVASPSVSISSEIANTYQSVASTPVITTQMPLGISPAASNFSPVNILGGSSPNLGSALSSSSYSSLVSSVGNVNNAIEQPSGMEVAAMIDAVSQPSLLEDEFAQMNQEHEEAAAQQEIQEELGRLLNYANAEQNTAPTSSFLAGTGGAAAGLGTGLKANVNGAVHAAGSLVSFGTWNTGDVWAVNDFDRSVGYNTATAISQASFTVLASAGTGTLAAGAGRIGQVANAFELASNSVNAGRAGVDIANNGLNWENGLQLTGSTLGAVANASALRASFAASSLPVLPEAIHSPFQVHINPETGIGPMAIDTSTFTSGKVTMAGGIENSRQFWTQWANTYPETLSPANQALIAERYSPVVDGVWTRQFPEHAPYLDQVLVHHHLDYGPQAIPLPEPVHVQQPGRSIWHQ